MTCEAVAVRPSLAERIARRAAVNVFRCYQCRRCTSGCPTVEHFDLGPNRIMRAIQLGREREVLRSRSIWLCTSCQTCTARCPQDLDVARVMETLRIISQEQRIRPAVPSVHIFSQSALRGIRLFGRMYELGMMAELYTRLLLRRMLDLRRLLTADIPMALRMLVTGKLRLFPSVAWHGRAAPAATPEAGQLSVGYYPGCSLHATAVDYGLSTRAVARALGLRLIEPPGWVCCGTSPAHTTDRTLATALPMRNLAAFHAIGQTCVMMPCASCYERTRMAIYDVEHEPELRAAAARQTGYTHDGQIEVQHVLETFEKRVGLQRIAARVAQPLDGVRVACYYGCLLTRPPKVLQQPHPEYPMSMDRLVEALGGRPLAWSYKTECCGATLALTELPIMLQLCERILRNARQVGADAVVVACPLCHANLDMRQGLLQLPGGRLPIIYITQLMGLAFGLPADALGLDKHLVDPRPLLRARRLVA